MNGCPKYRVKVANWRHTSCAGDCGIATRDRPAADDYPSRTIRMIVPFGAGGPTDVFTRAIGEELRKALGQPIVMENRPGAGTIIGTTEAAKSAARRLHAADDLGDADHGRDAQSEQAVPADARLRAGRAADEFRAGAGGAGRSPVSSLKELIALAKAKPGTLNYGSSGPGSNYHMAGELF